MSACLACPVGSFTAASGSTTCEACPAGQTTTSTPRTACSDCPPGSFATAGSTLGCQSCPVNTYAPDAGSDLCLACSAGFAALSGSTGCTACGPGTRSSSSGACVSCSAGTYASSPANAQCLTCAPGTAASAGASSCAECEPGTYASSGQSSCASCPAGTSSNQFRASVCPNCGIGFAAGAGSTTCTACGAGTYGPLARNPSCLQCPAGTFSNGTINGGCTACAPGSAAGAGASICSLCTPGTFAAGGQSTCTLCPAGTSADGFGTTSCPNCGEGYASGLGATACIACGPGTYGPNSRNPSCLVCAAGYISTGTANGGCTACPAGYTSNTDRTQCVPCGPGLVASTPGSPFCSSCPRGSYSNETFNSVCSLCKAGEDSVTQASSCTPCAAGTANGVMGGICQTCAVGRFASAPGALACQACAAGTSTWAEVGFVTCSPCDAGTVASSAGVACSSCPVGAFANETGMTACLLCPPGFSSNSGASSCFPCSAGTAGAGGEPCLPCSQGRYTPVQGLSGCLACDPGSTSNTVLGGTSCVQCSPGQSNPRAAGACVLCGAGTFTDTSGAVNCSLCDAGEESDSTRTQCFKCAVGAVNRVQGGTCVTCRIPNACTELGLAQCPPIYTGRFCEKCVSGYYFKPALGDCDVCPSAAGAIVMMIVAVLLGLLVVIFLTSEDGAAHELAVIFGKVFSFLSWTFVLVTAMNIPWPPELVQFYNDVVAFVLMHFQIIPECLVPMPYYTRWVVFSLFPVYLLFLIVLAKLIQHCRGHGGASESHPATEISANFFSLMSVFLVMYLNMLADPLRIVALPPLEDDSANVTISTWTLDSLRQLATVAFWVVSGVMLFVIVIIPSVMPFIKSMLSTNKDMNSPFYDMIFSDYKYSDADLDWPWNSARDNYYTCGPVLAPFRSCYASLCNNMCMCLMLCFFFYGAIPYLLAATIAVLLGYYVFGLIASTSRGYAALEFISRIVLVAFAAYGTSGTQSAIASVVLVSLMLFSFISTAIVKGVAVGDGFTTFAAPFGDENNTYFQRLNILEFMSLIATLIQSVLALLFATGLPKTTTWAIALSLTVAVIFVLAASITAFIVCRRQRHDLVDDLTHLFCCGGGADAVGNCCNSCADGCCCHGRCDCCSGSKVKRSTSSTGLLAPGVRSAVHSITRQPSREDSFEMEKV